MLTIPVLKDAIIIHVQVYSIQVSSTNDGSISTESEKRRLALKLIWAYTFRSKTTLG